MRDGIERQGRRRTLSTTLFLILYVPLSLFLKYTGKNISKPRFSLKNYILKNLLFKLIFIVL